MVLRCLMNFFSLSEYSSLISRVRMYLELISSAKFSYILAIYSLQSYNLTTISSLFFTCQLYSEVCF